MLPADVGAAPAAATRYQGTSSTPAAAAGRDRPASGPDPFGDLVDQYAGDAEPAATSGRRAVRHASRQAPTMKSQTQPLGTDAPGNVGPTPSVTSQPRQDDVPGVVVVPAAADETRTDLVVPAMLTPLDLPQPVGVAAGGLAGRAAEPDGSRPVPDGAMMSGAPLRPGTWLRSMGPVEADIDADIDAPQLPDADDPLAAAEQPAASTGVALENLGQAEGMPPEAASPEVRAALRAARAVSPAGAPGLGAAVSMAASHRSGQTAQPAGPVAPADPRAVAMAAVREALSQPVDGPDPAAASTAASVPETNVAAAPSPVAQSGVHAVNRPVTAAVAPGDESGVVTTTLDVLTAAAQPQATGAGSAPETTARQPQAGAGAVRLPRHAKQATGQTQNSDATASLSDAASNDEAVQATPGRKATQDEAPVQPARPTARAAQAIAAFHAAAAVGATSTPAAVNAAVAGAAVSSTPLLDAELPTQLIQAIRVQFDHGSGEARIRLNPGFLGGVTVGVQIDGSSVTASLQAASADVREWMRTNESMLRQALADQGLQLDRLVIVDEEAPASGDEHDTRPHEEREQQAPPRQRRSADQGTFELVF